MSENLILERLKGVKDRFEEVGRLITEPDIIADMKRYVRLNKEYKNLEPVVQAYEEYKNLLSNIKNTKDMLASEKDEEFREMAKMELDELSEQVVPMEEKIKFILIPTDPEDDKNALVEIRAGTGGDEASIFAGDLYRMYSKFCETKKWKLEVSSFSEGTAGGYKEIIMRVAGDGAYGTMKYESGVHRVQRVPQTETQGRVHTSAITVAIIPEVDDVEVDLKPNDIKLLASGRYKVGFCLSKAPSKLSIDAIPTKSAPRFFTKFLTTIEDNATILDTDK